MFQEDSDAIYLVTEPVVPLGSLLKDLTELDVALGTYIIASSLNFLHKNAHMSHNNIRVKSIFVSLSDNLWRLGGLENVCKEGGVDDRTVGDIVRSSSPQCPAAPEDTDGTFSSNNIHCRDSWMLGHLVIKLTERFNGKPDGGLMKFKQTVKKSFCNADPRKRPSVESFLSCQYFKSYPQHALIYSVEFLESITIKSDEDKKNFFRKASTDLIQVSSDLFQKYLMRLMFSDLIFADENAREYLLPRLLSVKTKRESRGFYKAESYARIMAPLLKELFKRRAKHTRLVLLRLTRWYVPFLPSHFVKDSILPEILLGLNDTDDAIVMATFNSLAVLTSFLGATTVVGSSLQKSHFHDAFPRGAEPKALATTESLSDGVGETSFSQTMNGKIMNDSDLDSGKEYPMVHVSRQDMLKSEREKRAQESKRKREARKIKEQTQQNQVKLIEVASRPEPKKTTPEGVSDIASHSILKKERFIHERAVPQLVHEQQGCSMEYKPESLSDGGMWDSENNLDLPVSDEEGGQRSLLEIARQTSESEDREGDIDLQVSDQEDNVETPVNMSSKVNSDNEEMSAAAVIDTSGNHDDGFSNWENGGWSDFDTQFESDEGIEMKGLKLELSEVKPLDTVTEDAQVLPQMEQPVVVPATVSDIMNLERAVQEEPEVDFFADMQPTYTAPKLL